MNAISCSASSFVAASSSWTAMFPAYRISSAQIFISLVIIPLLQSLFIRSFRLSGEDFVSAEVSSVVAISSVFLVNMTAVEKLPLLMLSHASVKARPAASGIPPGHSGWRYSGKMDLILNCWSGIVYPVPGDDLAISSGPFREQLVPLLQ